MKKLFMRGTVRCLFVLLLSLFVIVSTSLVGCKIEKTVTVDFAIETLAMAIGYELRTGFEWTSDVDRYYNGIMDGKVSLDAAKAAEGYLRTKTHTIIANRLVKLASMVGFNMDDAGKLIGVDNVDIHLLQVAAQGFRQGILLSKPMAQNDDNVNLSKSYDSGISLTVENIKEMISIASAKTNSKLGIPEDLSQRRKWMQDMGFLLTDEEIERITPKVNY